MSSQPWEDRRALFQRGKEVHEPGRRLSQGTGGVVDAVKRASVSSVGSLTLDKTPTNNSTGSPSPTGQRRRSSGASAGLFGNLQHHKRGGEDYDVRRASHSDQMAGGMLSGWFNSTFRGMKKPDKDASDTTS